MSVDIFVFLALENEPTVPKWNQALAEQKTSVHIAEVVDLTKHSGFLPMTLNGRGSGCEFLRGPYSDISEVYPKLAKPPFARTVYYQLSFGGDPTEAATCLLSASALVGKFKGVAFDPQGGAFVSERELVSSAASMQKLK